MAKKINKVQTVHSESIDSISTFPVSDEGSIESNISTTKIKDPLADKVKALRDKGFDDNRIAATLMIQVSTLNDYK